MEKNKYIYFLKYMELTSNWLPLALKNEKENFFTKYLKSDSGNFYHDSII